MHSQADWSRMATQFQENLGAGWMKALESFQQLGGGTAAGTESDAATSRTTSKPTTNSSDDGVADDNIDLTIDLGLVKVTTTGSAGEGPTD